MIHEKKVKDPSSGELKTEYTSDREDCKVVMVDGKPVEKKMEMGERRNRRDGQNIGKTKQRGVTKQHKKLERQRKERMSVIGRDIEDRLGEFVDRVLEETTISEKLPKDRKGSVLDRINNFLKENEEEETEEDDLEDVEIITDPKALEKLDPEERAKVEELTKEVQANADQLEIDDEDEDESEEEPEEEPVDDEESEEEPVDDEESEEEPVDDEESEEEPEEEPVDDEGGEELAPEEEPTDGNMNDDGEEESEEPVDELDVDNEFVTITTDSEYEIDTNNSYDYYEFLLNKLDDEAMTTKLNSAYIKIPKEKRKLVSARELLSNINDIIDSDESGGGEDAFGGEEDAGF